MNLALFYTFNIFAASIYVFLILFLNFYWKKYSNSVFTQNQIHFPFISIIIVGKDEEKNINNCINSIVSNDYPVEKYEIIFIDDESVDNSIDILKSINAPNFSWYKISDIANIQNINNHKKEAIKSALALAKGEIILQTDADTTVVENWIYTHAVQYMGNKNINLVTAPVLFIKENGILSAFQYYDMITTMGITAAGISSGLFYMANGANMSYRKKVYFDFKPDSKYASGDDMFLIHNVASKSKDTIKFLKDRKALVFTWPEKTLKDFIRQRLRWATKTKAYKDKNLQIIVAFVFIVNVLVLLNFILIPFFGIFQFIFSIIIFSIKILIDSYFILNISKFFEIKIKWRDLLLSLLIYPIYLVFIGSISLYTKKYIWKGRIVR